MRTVQTPRIAGDVYDIEDIIGKTLYPRYTVDVYNNTPSNGGKKIGSVKSGNPAGVVYSWVTDKNTKALWWQFSDGKTFYYIEHAVGRFDVKSLKQQGVLTTEQKIEEQKKKEEEDSKPWYQSLGEGLNSTAKTGLWILGGAIVISSLLRR